MQGGGLWEARELRWPRPVGLGLAALQAAGSLWARRPLPSASAWSPDVWLRASPPPAPRSCLPPHSSYPFPPVKDKFKPLLAHEGVFCSSFLHFRGCREGVVLDSCVHVADVPEPRSRGWGLSQGLHSTQPCPSEPAEGSRHKQSGLSGAELAPLIF